MSEHSLEQEVGLAVLDTLAVRRAVLRRGDRRLLASAVRPILAEAVDETA